MTLAKRQRVLLVGVFAVIAVFVVWVVVGAWPRTVVSSPAYTPMPLPTGRYELAQIAPLEPAAPAVSEFDAHPAVAVYRETEIVVAWIDLTNDPYIAQAVQYLDPEIEWNLVGYSNNVNRYAYIILGPIPSVIESVVEHPDGSVVVSRCGGQVREVRKDTGELRKLDSSPLSHVTEVTLTPLTEAETAELVDQGPEVPPYRVRDYHSLLGVDCDASAAVSQEFVDWESHAPIGEFDVSLVSEFG